MLGSQEGVVTAFISSLWPRGTESPLWLALMTLAVEPDAIMNGGDYRLSDSHPASLSARPPFGASHWGVCGET